MICNRKKNIWEYNHNGVIKLIAVANKNNVIPLELENLNSIHWNGSFIQKLHSWKSLFSFANEQTEPQRKSMLVHSCLAPSS